MLAHLMLAGYVVEADPSNETGLRVRDASGSPDTHLNREYIREMAGDDGCGKTRRVAWQCSISHF